MQFWFKSWMLSICRRNFKVLNFSFEETFFSRIYFLKSFLLRHPPGHHASQAARKNNTPTRHLRTSNNISRVRNSREICSANLWHFGAHAIMSEKLLYIQKLICHLFRVRECLKSFMKAGKRLSALQAHLCSPTHTRKQFICSEKSGKTFSSRECND